MKARRPLSDLAKVTQMVQLKHSGLWMPAVTNPPPNPVPAPGSRRKGGRRCPLRAAPKACHALWLPRLLHSQSSETLASPLTSSPSLTVFLKHCPLFIPPTSQAPSHPRALELAVPGPATFSTILISQDWPLLIIAAFLQGALREACSRSRTLGPSLCPGPSHPAVVFSAQHTSPARVVSLT